MAAPAAEQRLHAVENLRVVVDAQNRHAGELAGIGALGFVAAPRPLTASRHRHLDREARALPGCRSQLDLVTEHARDALHDRKAKPEAARDLGAFLQAVEFAEHALLCDAGMPSPVSQTSIRKALAPAAADQHAALRRVLDRVGDQVLQQPAQQSPVRPHRQPARTKIRSSPFSRASGANSTSSWRITSSIRNETDFRLHRPGIEPRNVEQRAENLLHRVERGVDIGDEPRRPRRAPCRSTSEVT